jgi:hypothetical protein
VALAVNRENGGTRDAGKIPLTVEVGTALVTAARRYCFEREPRLLPADFDSSVFHISASITGREGPEFNTDALEWVLVGIEGIDIDRFAVFEDLQSHLIGVVRDVSGQYVDFWNARLDNDTRNELEALCRYIGSLTPDAVKKVKPLPHRRPLGESEVRSVWQQIAARWGLPETPPASVAEAAWRRSHRDVLLSDVEAFGRAIPPRVLRSILQGLGVSRIWKLDLPEERWSFEMDLSFVDTYCDWGECYWVTQDLDWILYVSHESDLVVEGTALLQRIRAAWNARVEDAAVGGI